MADWKQIAARIHRARASKDPAGQLSNLYGKTHDAMVAFELGKFLENSGQNSEAAKWYSAAAERFRRADWKTKAQEAAVRLAGSSGEATSEPVPLPAAGFQLTPPATDAQEKELPFERNPEALESAVAMSSEVKQATETEASTPPQARKGGRPRGRRGGRNRRRGSSPSAAAHRPEFRSPDDDGATRESGGVVIPSTSKPEPQLGTHTRPAASVPPETAGERVSPSIKGRYGDPGLSSRISLLEMQFRRLLACPPARLDEAQRAPAGPGVMVLTDSDLTTYYYVEACQTLRIAIASLLRGGSSRRGGDSIKPRLAEHLGIPESRVTKYLAEHCVVRWLQLDEGASHFAHFVIAVLRPTLNE